MNRKLVSIHTYITQEQYDQLHKQSYKGKKTEQQPQDKTFSEHLRQALDNYLATDFNT